MGKRRRQILSFSVCAFLHTNMVTTSNSLKLPPLSSLIHQFLIKSFNMTTCNRRNILPNSFQSVAAFSHLEREKQQQFQRVHSKLTICLHVKSTQRQVSIDSSISLKDCPLYPALLSNVILKTTFYGCSKNI